MEQGVRLKVVLGLQLARSRSFPLQGEDLQSISMTLEPDAWRPASVLGGDASTQSPSRACMRVLTEGNPFIACVDTHP